MDRFDCTWACQKILTRIPYLGKQNQPLLSLMKLFRKIRQQLFTQNKVSVYLLYGLGEIVLVVIGILIALQINNWNEERKDRITEKSVLLELQDNLERNMVLIDNAIADIIEINETTGGIIEIIEEKKSYPDTLIHHFGQMFRSGSYILELNTNGYESLKNIGLEILSSKALKNEILSLFEISYPGYNKHSEVINAIWGNNPRSWYDYFYIRPLEQGLIPLDYSTLKEDKKFMTIVRDLESGRNSILERMKLCQSETHRVLQLVQDELVKLSE